MLVWYLLCLFLLAGLSGCRLCRPLNLPSISAQAKASDKNPIHHSTLQELDSTNVGLYLERSGGRKVMRIKRRIGIGSMAPTCTYNECRGCKYKCRAEQTPVDGNDPINSPYHYKCVCHRT